MLEQQFKGVISAYREVLERELDEYFSYGDVRRDFLHLRDILPHFIQNLQAHIFCWCAECQINTECAVQFVLHIVSNAPRSCAQHLNLHEGMSQRQPV